MTETTPSIYVIIPVYNCKEYLEDAVSSALEQPYPRLSVYLVFHKRSVKKW